MYLSYPQVYKKCKNSHYLTKQLYKQFTKSFTVSLQNLINTSNIIENKKLTKLLTYNSIRQVYQSIYITKRHKETSVIL